MYNTNYNIIYHDLINLYKFTFIIHECKNAHNMQHENMQDI